MSYTITTYGCREYLRRRGLIAEGVLELRRPAAPSIDCIQAVVALYYGLPQSEMISGCSARAVARPRQVAMHLSRMLTPRSLATIGRSFGGRDHSTVIHAVRQIERLAGQDPEIRADLDFLIAELQS